MNLRRLVSLGLLALLATTAPARAEQRWGRVESVEVRFGKITVIQDGNKRHFPLKVNADTVFVLRDGRTLFGLDLHELEGQRVFTIVEENPDHFITKLWLRPDVPASLDPVNPGAGAILPYQGGAIRPSVEPPPTAEPQP